MLWGTHEEFGEGSHQAHGLSFTSGSPAIISGVPATGSGGQYTLALTDDAGSAGTASQSVVLNVYEGPAITSANEATFVAGTPGTFEVTTTGYPTNGTQAMAANSPPPTSPSQGEGMYFTVTGLPASLQYSNLNPAGWPTGTLTIQGTPAPSDAGTYNVQITAQNGVGTVAQQTLNLKVITITGPAPVSGKKCNGNYNGTFKGDLTVTAGQNCNFVAGGVTGNVNVKGGSFGIVNAAVSGNVVIEGNSAFSVGQNTTIAGELRIHDDSSTSASNQVCGTAVKGDLTVADNATAIQIGSTTESCDGNRIGGKAEINGNTKAVALYNNDVTDNLACSGNSAITGGGNIAAKKKSQCSTF
jgi:hypothetical protein